MAEQRKQGDQRVVPDALRAAIERTFAATAEGAAETRDRASEMLDDVARRGRDARDAVGARAQEARESSTGAASRVIEAIEGMRLASREDVRHLTGQVEELSKQVDRLETRVRTLETKPKVEG
jgi:polyhydroxyalkanoate synthesis regulator phasin